MQASMLVFLLVAAVSRVHATGFAYKACSQSSFSGPLARTYPIHYDLMLNVSPDSSILSSVTRINIKTDDSRSQQIEPRNVVVLNADQSIDIESVVMFKEEESRPNHHDYLEIDVCRDTRKQLLVIRTNENIENESRLFLMINSQTLIRDDNRGVHKVKGMRVIEADFSNSNAHLSIPCFDTSNYKTSVGLRLSFSPDFSASSQVLAFKRGGMMGKQKYVIPERVESIVLDELSFELRSADK